MRGVLIVLLVLFPPAALAASAETITLDVRNMTCALCRITVGQALRQVPGVTAAAVDPERRTATVTYDPDLAGPDALTRATTRAGYPSTLRAER